MERRCPDCGVRLNKTTHGRWYCPNHGIIEEEESSEEKDRGYIR